ncbi:MAG: hypothetical protein J6S69_05550 [Proteobacteria bacterium]|nr:hypothetical protein [Pseudomonadota bacterium]
MQLQYGTGNRLSITLFCLLAILCTYFREIAFIMLDLNAFEWIVLAICGVLILGLMNMFPACRWLAAKSLGMSTKKEDSAS